MKYCRRRRHLRPRPTRSQINQQVARVRSNMELFKLKILLEAAKVQPSLPRFRFLHQMLVALQDEITDLEAWA